VLVDHSTGDDAGVFLLQPGLALVQTVDFFTPVVDDPEAYGAIAAANALSDVYAMGGKPLTALSIAALPEKDFPVEWSAAIFRGGLDKLREAGCALLGGHTVRDPEIKFGYAITGVVDPDEMMTNAAGRVGDVVVLTKPLGTGVIATAVKAGQAPAEVALAAQRSMATLNRIPAAVARRHGVRAATDITGFGFAGHTANVARESRLTIEIRLADLPLLPGARELSARHQPAGLKANRRQFEPQV
jgi:selenide,water dikinase